MNLRRKISRHVESHGHFHLAPASRRCCEKQKHSSLFRYGAAGPGATLRPSTGDLPSFVHVGEIMSNNSFDIPGELAGFLGAAHDPFITGDPSLTGYRTPGLAPQPALSLSCLNRRDALLGDLDRSLGRLADDPAVARMDLFHAARRRSRGPFRPLLTLELRLDSADPLDRRAQPRVRELAALHELVGRLAKFTVGLRELALSGRGRKSGRDQAATLSRGSWSATRAIRSARSRRVKFHSNGLAIWL